MVKKIEVIKFETNDGLQFDTEIDAIKHESKAELERFFDDHISGYHTDYTQDIAEHIDELIELLIKLKLVKPI